MPKKNDPVIPRHQRAKRLTGGGKLYTDRDYTQFIKHKWMKIALFLLFGALYAILPIYLLIEGLIVLAITVTACVFGVFLLLWLMKKFLDT